MLAERTAAEDIATVTFDMMATRRPIGTDMVGPMTACKCTPLAPPLCHRGGDKRRPGPSTKCFASARPQILDRRHLGHSGGGGGWSDSDATKACLRGDLLSVGLPS